MLQGQELYDLISKDIIEPKVEYYKLLIANKDKILHDCMLYGQKTIAEKLSNKEHSLSMTPSKLSAIVNIFKAL